MTALTRNNGEKGPNVFLLTTLDTEDTPLSSVPQDFGGLQLKTKLSTFWRGRSRGTEIFKACQSMLWSLDGSHKVDPDKTALALGTFPSPLARISRFRRQRCFIFRNTILQMPGEGWKQKVTRKCACVRTPLRQYACLPDRPVGLDESKLDRRHQSGGERRFMLSFEDRRPKQRQMSNNGLAVITRLWTHCMSTHKQ